MSEERDFKILRLILFMCLMLLIVELSPISAALFSGSMFELVATAVFFLTFILMYAVTAGFVSWEGGSGIGELGVDIDDSTINHIIIGAIAGSAASFLVVVIASVFGGDLRPLDQITGDLIAAEIMITAPTAFFEELAHRGYILPRMESLVGKGGAIILSSIFFSFMHFSWWTKPAVTPALVAIFFFNIFLGGVVLSYSYYLSGRKLWIPIAFHFMWNMIAYLLFPHFPNELVNNPMLYQIEWGVTTVFGFMFGIFVIWNLYLVLGKKKE